jgi:SsrA-binding protein
MKTKVVAENKKARFDYEFIDTLEAGVALTGPEVKSTKESHISIKEAYVVPKDKELMLINAHISPYNPAATNNTDPKRSRRLLLKRSEIDDLIIKSQAGGLTIVPNKVYLKNGLVKVEIALAKGKKAYDKRETLKRRDIDREIQRELKEKLK